MPSETVVDIFIGQRFGQEGQLEVVCWDGSRRGNSRNSNYKLYTVKCHKCHLDRELHGDATYKVAKGSLILGHMPCGCAKKRMYSKEQWEVVLRRECEERNCVFIGFPETNSNSRISKAKITLSCKVCDNEWSTGCAETFMAGVGCPKCGYDSVSRGKRKPDDVMIESFVSTGKFIDGTIFKRSDIRTQRSKASYWQVICPVCSTDEYVDNGVCSGVFESSSGHLQAGKRSCRCNKQYNWTTAQREYQINTRISDSELDYKFLDWKDGHKNKESKIVIQCNTHGLTWEPSVHAFVYSEQGCPACSKTGFNKIKDASLYVLIAEGRHSFVGFGISRVADRRLSTHTRNLASAGYTLGATQIFDMTGQQAWQLEQLLKKTFPLNTQDIEGFRTEATFYENYQDVIDFVDKWLFENT